MRRHSSTAAAATGRPGRKLSRAYATSGAEGAVYAVGSACSNTACSAGLRPAAAAAATRSQAGVASRRAASGAGGDRMSTRLSAVTASFRCGRWTSKRLWWLPQASTASSTASGSGSMVSE